MEHLEHEIPDLLRVDLPPQDRERILRHLDACPSCRAEWETIAILESRDRPERSKAPEGYFSTLPARILKRRMHPARRRSLNPLKVALRPVLPVAAGALLIYALLDVSGVPSSQADRLPIRATEAVEYLANDPVFPSIDLVPAAEPLLTDRSLLLQEHQIVETGLEDLEPQTAADVVAELDEAEIDRLLTKLSERVML